MRPGTRRALVWAESANALILCLAAFALGVSPARAQNAPALADYAAAQELQIVDCLLPGQVRVVGGRTYLTPRRPTRTTGADCRTRGGEYLAYDRADYKTALNVWLETAERGDAEAQNTVGEIFERGLGAEPNYEAAVDWYRRAADQGYSRAQFNIGTLYEQGLGVPQDRLEALNWYRKAWGLPEDSVIFRSAAEAEQTELRAKLEQQVAQRERQLELLQRQLDGLQRELSEQRRSSNDVTGEMDSLRSLIAQLQSGRDADRKQLVAMPAPAPATSGQSAPGGFRDRNDQEYRRRDFGRYYALIIGVQNYDVLDDLASPLNDAQRAKKVLEERYGFSVWTLADPNQLDVMRAINDLNDTLTENDNLLIYFAGHGSRLQSGTRESGYWLPTNAERAPDDTLWVPNEFITRHLGRLRAKRILVVSDSCYAGLLGDDPGYVMVGDARYSADYVKWKMPKRSRLVLVSGGDDPVLDSTSGGNSVFAHAVFDELERNDRVLTAPELFLRVRELVRQSPASGARQEPSLKVIKDAGHEVGDFFFVPG